MPKKLPEYWESDVLPIKVTRQGAMRVNAASIVRRGPQVLAVELDMRSKHGHFSYTITSEKEGPTIGIDAVEESIHLHKRKDKEESTEVMFPTLVGWDVHSCTVTSYTARICFVRYK